MMRPATEPHALHARANGSSTAATHTLLMPPPAAEHHVDAAGQGAELGWDALPRSAPHHNRVLHHGAAQAGDGTCSETTAALFSPQAWQAGAARASCQRQGACCQASRRPTHLLGGVGCAAGQLLEVLHVARQAPWQAAACTPRCPSRLGLSKGRQARGKATAVLSPALLACSGRPAAALTLADAPALGGGHHDLEGAPSRRHGASAASHAFGFLPAAQWAGRSELSGGGGRCGASVGGGQAPATWQPEGGARRLRRPLLPSCAAQARRSSPAALGGVQKFGGVHCHDGRCSHTAKGCCRDSARMPRALQRGTREVPRWQPPCRSNSATHRAGDQCILAGG